MIKQNRMYGTLLNPLYEGVDLDELCVATYLVGAKKDEEIVIKAQSIGIEQTTGSWVDVPEETDEVRAKYASKVIGIYEVPAFENQTNVDIQVAPDGMRFYILRIGYPVVNIKNNIPLLLATQGTSLIQLISAILKSNVSRLFLQRRLPVLSHEETPAL